MIVVAPRPESGSLRRRQLGFERPFSAPFDHRAKPVQVARQRARLQADSLDVLLLLALARRGQHVVHAVGRDHDRAVGIEDRDVPRLDQPVPNERCRGRLRHRQHQHVARCTRSVTATCTSLG